MSDTKTEYVDNVRFQSLLVDRWQSIRDMNPSFDFSFNTLEFTPVDDLTIPEDHDFNDDELDVHKKNLKKVLQSNERLKHEAMADIKRPPVSEEIGGIFYKISNNLSYRYNFINYSYRDEMVGDGAETCLRYIDKYNCVKYTNPFTYFTQTCFFAFVRRIKKESGYSDIKSAFSDSQMLEFGLVDKYEFQNSVVDSYYRESVE